MRFCRGEFDFIPTRSYFTPPITCVDAFQNVMCTNNYLPASDSILLTILNPRKLFGRFFLSSALLLLLSVTLFHLYCRFLCSSHFQNVDRNHFHIKIYTHLRSEWRGKYSTRLMATLNTSTNVWLNCFLIGIILFLVCNWEIVC